VRKVVAMMEGEVVLKPYKTNLRKAFE